MVALAEMALMKVAPLVMVGQGADMTSQLRNRRMTVTTPPPIHSQVSIVHFCMCMFMCVSGHVMWAVSMSVLL